MSDNHSSPPKWGVKVILTEPMGEPPSGDLLPVFVVAIPAASRADAAAQIEAVVRDYAEPVVTPIDPIAATPPILQHAYDSVEAREEAVDKALAAYREKILAELRDDVDACVSIAADFHEGAKDYSQPQVKLEASARLAQRFEERAHDARSAMETVERLPLR